jgi:hypothetical protein
VAHSAADRRRRRQQQQQEREQPQEQPRQQDRKTGKVRGLGLDIFGGGVVLIVAGCGRSSNNAVRLQLIGDTNIGRIILRENAQSTLE